MSAAIRSQAAYLLHSRPFRDSSLLLDLLTRDHGRISAIARGVRSVKSKNKALLQSFIPLQIDLSGKSELKTLTRVEALGHPARLGQQNLFAALYLNELLTRLLHRQEGDVEVFALYETVLEQLSAQAPIEPVLRSFELDLLELLGYGIDFDILQDSTETSDEGLFYYFAPDTGFEPVSNPAGGVEKYYPLHVLHKISARQFDNVLTLKFAKRLLRSAFAVHLGDRELSSRKLFRKNN